MPTEELKNDNNQTPLYLAAEKGDLEAVLALLKEKADPNKANLSRLTPLHLAAQNGHLAVVRALLAIAFSGLYIAVRNGHIEVVRALLASSANPNKASWKGLGLTPLHIASKRGRTEIVHAFLAKGADPSLLNNAGESAVSIAELSGNQAAFELFKAHAAQMREEVEGVLFKDVPQITLEYLLPQGLFGGSGSGSSSEQGCEKVAAEGDSVGLGAASK